MIHQTRQLPIPCIVILYPFIQKLILYPFIQKISPSVYNTIETNNSIAQSEGGAQQEGTDEKKRGE